MTSVFSTAFSFLQKPAPSVIAVDADWEWVGSDEGYLRRRNIAQLSPEQRYFQRPPVNQILIARRLAFNPSSPLNLLSGQEMTDQSFFLSIRTVDPDSDEDVEILHRWMNDPRVANFWGEQGPVDHQRRYLKTMGWHSTPTFICNDGKPFAYLEIYWARPDRIHYYHHTELYDRGVHVLVGEQAMLGKLPLWKSIVVTWIFLEEPRATKLYGEPRIDNVKFIEKLKQLGFESLGPDAIMPHKRAALIGFHRSLAEERWKKGWKAVVDGIDLKTSGSTSFLKAKL
ncbi:hypothetical protein HDU96_008781 [Phlyctochytrium bullatum]|nr:hypothetical protein HDU96_008781 [Phlyctochytrium bullatum]